MAVNKVIYGEETLIDLTSDTSDSPFLIAGITGHNKKGEVVTGTFASGYPETLSVPAIVTDNNGIQLTDSEGNIVYGAITYKRGDVIK